MLENNDERVKEQNQQKTTYSDLNSEDQNIFEDLRYICASSKLIVDSLKRGCDVAQLTGGRIMITETKKVQVLYRWDKKKNTMMKMGHSTIVAHQNDDENIFEDLRYICASSKLIVDSLRLERDVAQLPDGRIIITETIKIHVLYEWNEEKNKMVKISQT